MKPRTLKEIIKEMATIGTSPETIDQDISNISKSIMAEVKDVSTAKLTFHQIRVNKGISVDEVSEKMGLSANRIEWHESNPGDLTAEEALEFCKFYGVSINDVTFSETGYEREYFDLYPETRRMTFITSLKSKVSNMMLSISNDAMYTDRALMTDLFDILDDIQAEDEIIMNEIKEQFNRKNRLNNTLAGR
ncbi:helix-turn-helix transcriptional regulator [Paenibacillus vini]|uniref:helix-turn-helix domain-containing protein n=1 Tax=Paenibacillus vini TaxID=1476024 RepID=UPI0025B6693E|nr:helix-turn-helix transcriptional regulator [Paenibacillus vini]MDN4069239.1 helix-turn-helix transcriptional regulator [Paenibacillus vini]MDN4069292.1 helix-turn-helix transcriptional regulator [Paenibacillus vini]